MIALLGLILPILPSAFLPALGFPLYSLLDSAQNLDAHPPASEFDNEYLFTAQRFDLTTHQALFRHRYLIPITGRFATRDPIEYPDGPNAYAAWFVGTNSGDIFGLCAPTCKCTSMGINIGPLNMGLSLKDFSAQIKRAYTPDQRGGQLKVTTTIQGTGDPSACKIRRFVVDDTWDTEGGTEHTIAHDSDDGYRNDGPAMSIKSGPATNVPVTDNKGGWRMIDYDAPGLVVSVVRAPAHKFAKYYFLVLNDDNTISPKCARAYSISIDINKQGITKPNAAEIEVPAWFSQNPKLL